MTQARKANGKSTAKPAAKPAGRETDAYLRRLGERVRTLRNQRGMTRKALARHPKLSEPTSPSSRPGSATARS